MVFTAIGSFGRVVPTAASCCPHPADVQSDVVVAVVVDVAVAAVAAVGLAVLVAVVVVVVVALAGLAAVVVAVVLAAAVADVRCVLVDAIPPGAPSVVLAEAPPAQHHPSKNQRY